MKSANDLLAWIDARPFQPFIIYLADGRSFEIKRPSALSVSDDERVVAVWHQGFHIIDLAHVTGIRSPSSVPGQI